MGELLVRGHAEAWVQPGRAVLDVTATARDPRTQRGAVEQLAGLCERVDEAVEERRDGRGGVVRRVVVSSITTAEDVEYGPGGQRRRVGFSAVRTTRIECVADADGLTDLVGALVQDDVQVRGPRWKVDDDDPAWLGVRTAAVADARRRAEAYALAVDGQVGAVGWIAEPGVRDGGEPPGPPHGGAAIRLASAPAGDDGDGTRTVRVAVEPVRVAVDVEAAFDLRP